MYFVYLNPIFEFNNLPSLTISDTYISEPIYLMSCSAVNSISITNSYFLIATSYEVPVIFDKGTTINFVNATF